MSEERRSALRQARAELTTRYQLSVDDVDRLWRVSLGSQNELRHPAEPVAEVHAVLRRYGVPTWATDLGNWANV